MERAAVTVLSITLTPYSANVKFLKMQNQKKPLLPQSEYALFASFGVFTQNWRQHYYIKGTIYTGSIITSLSFCKSLV